MSTQSVGLQERTQTRAANPRLKRNIVKGVTLVVLIILALLWLMPILWALDTSLKPESETTLIPVTWFSSHLTFQSYVTTLATSNMLRWYFNSILTSAIITAATVLVSSLAAFSFSRIPFRGRNVLFWIILAGIMIPGQILIVPLFTEMQSFGLVDTYWSIILPQIASPVMMFVFKQFFDGIPRELEESALMDGASRLRVYWQIWMPLSGSAIAAVAIFTFVFSWNNFILPFIMLTGNNMMTIPVGLATVQTSFGIHYAQIMASAVLGGVPVLIVFLFFQRQIVQGIAGTGLKG